MIIFVASSSIFCRIGVINGVEHLQQIVEESKAKQIREWSCKKDVLYLRAGIINRLIWEKQREKKFAKRMTVWNRVLFCLWLTCKRRSIFIQQCCWSTTIQDSSDIFSSSTIIGDANADKYNFVTNLVEGRPGRATFTRVLTWGKQMLRWTVSPPSSFLTQLGLRRHDCVVP